MGLHIDTVRFEDFRSYASLELDNLAGTTVLVGPNAAGKTNAIEGMQLLTACGSFRNPRSADLVRWGKQRARLCARFISDTRDLSVSLEVRPGVRSYAVNGKKKAVQDLQGILPSVTFSPDDLFLVKGTQSARRAALDLVGCQLSRNHRVIKRDYEKLVKHKNALLRDEAPALLLESVNDMLAPTALQLFLYRQALVSNLAKRMASAYEAIAGGAEHIEAVYVPSWEEEHVKQVSRVQPLGLRYDRESAEVSLRRAMQRRGTEERARRRSVVGPHADHVEFFIDGRNASMFASQGQQRSLVLAWKIAEVGIVEEMLGVPPVLLLDDVMSELDASRRAALMALVSKGSQVFVTTTDTSFFEEAALGAASVVELKGGLR